MAAQARQHPLVRQRPQALPFNAEAIERIPYMAPGLVGPEKAARGKLPTDTWWHTIVPTNGAEKTGYPTQKPLGILNRIVQASSAPGDLVLDFFAGSGTTGAACLELGRRFLLVDNNPAALEVMARRFAILIEKIDARARLNSGSPRPYSMIEGIDEGVDGALFIGYHARAGTPNAILDHTWSSSRVEGVWLTPAGGERMAIGEIGLNGAVCGHFGAPVVMISGDQSACAEAASLFPGIVTAVVKQAKGRNAAECLPPSVTAELIEQCAAKGVDHLLGERPPKPLRLQGPVTVAVEYVKSEMADDAAILPGAQRAEAKVVEFIARDMHEAYRAFRSLVGLA
jgi:D-amino peptidase